MAKSEEIPIVTPTRDYDNPFNDQTAFSPPQGHHVILDPKRGLLGGEKGGGGGGVVKFDHDFGGRERSASQPTAEQLRNSTQVGPSPLIRPLDGRGNSNPNLTTENPASRLFAPPTSGLHPLDRAHSTPIKDCVESEGIQGFYSAPVTPCQTPIGSRQGSPKAERKKVGGLLGAIFGAGIYGRGTSEGGTPVLLGHVAEDNEDDFTPVGSPSNFTIDELKTRLRGVDEDDVGVGGGGDSKIPAANFAADVDAFQFPRHRSPATGAAGVVAAPPTIGGLSKKMKKRENGAESDYSYRELTIIAPTSM